MHFALPLLVALLLWFVALLSGVREVPAIAVCIACVLSYLTVLIGRYAGFLPSKVIHVGFIPVLVAIGTAVTIPLQKFLPVWMDQPQGKFAITVEIDPNAQVALKNHKPQLEHVPTAGQLGEKIQAGAKAFAGNVNKQVAAVTGKPLPLEPPQAQPVAIDNAALKPLENVAQVTARPKSRNPDDDDIEAIANMHQQIQHAAESKGQGFKMPSPEEMKKYQEEAQKLLNQ